MGEKLPFKRIQRTRPRTQAETARDAEVREQVRREFAQREPSGGMTMRDFFEIQSIIATLKQERTAQELSLAEVSRRTGIAASALSRLERGKQINPPLHTLVRYAKAVGLHLSLALEESVQPVGRS